MGVLAAVRSAARRQPGAVLAWMRDPTLATHVRCLRKLRRGQGDPSCYDPWMAELCAGLALRLFASGLLDRGLRLTRLPRRIVSLGLRRVVELPPQATALELQPDSACIRMGDDSLGSTAVPLDLSACPSPYHRVDGDLFLAEVDNNPLSDFEAHPEKEGNRLDLGGHSPEAWAEALREALGKIERYLPEIREEIDLVVRLFVPVGYHPTRHLSASYQEALGLVYLTLHPRVMTLAEAIIHEFSHNKLNALLEQDPLLHNAFHPLFSSPVRPDPRPLHGILLAVHAFQPVARLYERMIEAGAEEATHPDFLARYKEIRRGNHEGATVLLEHARPTATGRILLDEIARWDRHFEAA